MKANGDADIAAEAPVSEDGVAQDTAPEDTAPEDTAPDGSATDDGTPADSAAAAGEAPRAGRSGRPAEFVESEAPPTPWRIDTAGGSLAPRSSLDILIDVNDKVMSGQIADYEPVPLGMPPIDRTIGGGLRPGEMLLMGGAQGTGKTTMALQMARNIAASGQAYVLYICFEHDEADLLNRIIAMESILPRLPHKAGAVKIQDVRSEVLGTWAKAGEGLPDIAANPKLRPSLERLARYGHNLFLNARLGDREHRRQPPRADPAAPRAVG